MTERAERRPPVALAGWRTLIPPSLPDDLVGLERASGARSVAGRAVSDRIPGLLVSHTVHCAVAPEGGYMGFTV